MKVIGVFIYLKEAFDTVSYQVILGKLAGLGTTGIAFDWYKSYLTNTAQSTRFNQKLSYNEKVPQVCRKES